VRQHRDGRQEVIDGPSRPEPEQAGCYYLIEADSMNEAVEWARQAVVETAAVHRWPE